MIRVLGDRVLVLLPPAPDDTVTASGIVLLRDPDAARLPTQGIIAQLGEKPGTVDLDYVRYELRTFFAERAADVAAGARYRITDIGDVVDVLLSGMLPASFDVAVGDCVLFPLGAGEEFTDDGHAYVVLRESEIIGVVPPMIPVIPADGTGVIIGIAKQEVHIGDPVQIQRRGGMTTIHKESHG